MTVHDAVYAVVLHRYIEETYAMRGERLTAKAEEKIRAIAGALGIRPQRNTGQLGFAADFTWSVDAIRMAKNRVRATDSMRLVNKLYQAIEGLSVKEIESYSESRPGEVE